MVNVDKSTHTLDPSYQIVRILSLLRERKRGGNHFLARISAFYCLVMLKYKIFFLIFTKIFQFWCSGRISILYQINSDSIPTRSCI